MSEQSESLKLSPDTENFGLNLPECDDSPWTREELEALAWERVKDEECDEYDTLAENVF